MASRNNFGLGTDDIYGVQEANRRKKEYGDKAKEFAGMEEQNIYTQNQAEMWERRANTANKQSTKRQGYEQNNIDFANAKDLTGYFNGSKRFGQKDYDYLKKVGAQDDVIANHIGGLEGKHIGENFRNNDLAKHVHADGFSSGAAFNKHDREYIEKNNLNLADEALKYAKRRGEKNKYGRVDNKTLDALREAGKLEEYDSYFARGHDKEKGISSYQQGKNFRKSDIEYLTRQGYSAQEITNHMASLKDGKDGGEGVSMAVGASNWLNKNNMLDAYSNYKAPNSAASEAKDRAQEHLNTKPDGMSGSNSDNSSNNNSIGMPDLSQFYTQMPGSNNSGGSSNNNNSNSGMPDLSQFYTQMPGSNNSGGSSNNNNSSVGMPDLSQFYTEMPGAIPGNSGNNSNSGMPDLSQFYTQMPGSNNSGGSSNNNNSNVGMPDLSQFYTQMPGSNNSGDSGNNSSGSLDLSRFMTPLPGSNSGNSGNSGNSSNGSLDLSRFMTPIGGYNFNSNSNSEDNKNQYSGALDLSKFMIRY
jgi:hypothetical protein